MNPLNQTSNILDRIFEYKKEELDHFKRQVALEDLKSKCQDTENPASFLNPFLQAEPSLKVIAEIKRQSPSKGIFRKNFNPVDIALAYEKNGAIAISVLTDEHFFGGHLDFLKSVHQKTSLPLLRKDFIWDPYQVYEARSAGASAILLIATSLSKTQIEDLQGLAEELSMHALVELYDPSELKKANCAKLLGVNNRNLKTFEVDLQKTEVLLSQVSSHVPLISESGFSKHEDLRTLCQKGVKGFLIGETFMLAEDPGLALKTILGG